MKTENQTKKYTFTQDAGHGWLSVKRQELLDLGIYDQISHYSYQRGQTVYLEEDCDMAAFFHAKEWKAWSDAEPFIKYSTSRADRSPIRSYDRFVAE